MDNATQKFNMSKKHPVCFEQLIRHRWHCAALASLCFLVPGKIHGADTNQVGADTLRQVLERLERDEAEIKSLKAQLAKQASLVPLATNSSDSLLQLRVEKDEAQLKDLQTQLNGSQAEALKPKYPSIQFHGFGDFDYAADNRKYPPGAAPTSTGVTALGKPNTFYEGELDLFATAQIADNMSFTMEPVLSAGLNNYMGIDLERTYFEYRGSDYFNFDVGRVHTALGYYNTTFHHGDWLQTAIGRPTVVQFEDSGGILPVHLTGVSLYGAIPSGHMNLNYRLEIGNGLDYSSNPNVNAVQQAVSFSDSKAVNLALTSRPEGLPGLQFGAGLYYDLITPDLASDHIAGEPYSLPGNNQLIPNAHIVFHNARWQLYNEFYLIHDQPKGGTAHDNPAFFTEVSRKFGVLTPYARFTYYHIQSDDLLYALAWAGGVNSGVHYGPSVGLRYDFTDYAAFKAQYDYLIDSGVNDASRITLQLCFTF
jgi:hypothetical protein